MEKGGTETYVFVPFWVGRKMLPVRGPVAYQFAISCGSGSGKMGNPGINPSDRIEYIGTIRGDLIANEEIFRNIFINPFCILRLLFDGPMVITDFPELIRRFIYHSAEAWGGGKDNQNEDKKRKQNPFRISYEVVNFHRYPAFLHNRCQRLNL
jgi:hypothetical protein